MRMYHPKTNGISNARTHWKVKYITILTVAVLPDKPIFCLFLIYFSKKIPKLQIEYLNKQYRKILRINTLAKSFPQNEQISHKTIN